jgi:hypothetical protein
MKDSTKIHGEVKAKPHSKPAISSYEYLRTRKERVSFVDHQEKAWDAFHHRETFSPSK